MLLGFVAGTVAVFALTEATRLVGLLTPMDNWGLFKLDVCEAALWGALASILALAVGLSASALPHIVVQTTGSTLCLAALLIVAARTDGLTSKIVIPILPMFAAGPLTGCLWLLGRPPAIKAIRYLEDSSPMSG